MVNSWNGLRTLTVEQFKREMGVSEIEVLRNEKTGKIFFSYGGATGAVSSKGIPSKPMLSEFPSNTGSGNVWVLHEKGEGGATKITTF